MLLYYIIIRDPISTSLYYVITNNTTAVQIHKTNNNKILNTLYF